MKRILLLFAALFTFQFSSWAQTAEPIKWTATYTAINDKEGEITITGNIEKDWHTYSIRKTNDGPVPTSITFEANKGYELVGEVTESGAHEVFDKAFDANMFVFTEKAEFKQKIKLKGKPGSTIKLKIEFMCCNNMMCLPPKTIDISVVTKK